MKIKLNSIEHKVKVTQIGKRGIQGPQGDPATNFVTSVNGKQGLVVIDQIDVGLPNVDNTADLDKPISNSTQTALDTKSSIVYVDEHKSDYTNPHKVTQAQVGLGNVDNTSDEDKPVSSAQAIANTDDRKRENHTGTQLASTISDFESVASNAAPVQSVAEKTGDVILVKSDVGLSNVDNTSDANKPVSSAVSTQLALKEDKANKGIANGYASLGADGKLIASQLPQLPIVDTYVVASQTAMLALAQADQGDVAIRTDLNRTFILSNNSPTVLSSWKELLTPTDAVTSVNGRTGSVVGLAEQSSLTAHTGNTNNPHSTTKSQVGLSDVDNTSDLNKPVSTATQTALNGKRAISNGTNLLYAVNGVGTQTTEKYDVQKTNWSIVQRDSNGVVRFADPISADQGATKGYVDTADALKADFPTVNNSIPVRGSSGNQSSLTYSVPATAGSVPLRDAGGRIAASAPVSGGDVATKTYVDDVTTINPYTVPYRNNGVAGPANDYIAVNQTSAVGNTIARRTADGKIFAIAGTADGHAVNVGQLNTKVTGVNTSKITVSATEPLGAVVGDLWVDIS